MSIVGFLLLFFLIELASCVWGIQLLVLVYLEAFDKPVFDAWHVNSYAALEKLKDIFMSKIWTFATVANHFV